MGKILALSRIGQLARSPALLFCQLVCPPPAAFLVGPIVPGAGARIRPRENLALRQRRQALNVAEAASLAQELWAGGAARKPVAEGVVDAPPIFASLTSSCFVIESMVNVSRIGVVEPSVS